MTMTVIGLALLVIGIAIMTSAYRYEPKQFGTVRLLTKAQLYPNHTPYTGPTYNRHDRELEATSEARQIQQ